MTLTINIPDDVADQVSSLTDADRRKLDETLGNLVAEAVDAFYEYDDETSQEIVTAGLEAIEEVKAGRLLTLEQMDARFEKDFADARARVQAQINSGEMPRNSNVK